MMKCRVAALVILLAWTATSVARASDDPLRDAIEQEFEAGAVVVAERYGPMLESLAYREALERAKAHPSIRQRLDREIAQFVDDVERDPERRVRYVAETLADFYELATLKIEERDPAVINRIQSQFETLTETLLDKTESARAKAIAESFSRDVVAVLRDATAHELRRPMADDEFEALLGRIEIADETVDHETAFKLLRRYVDATSAPDNRVHLAKHPKQFETYTGMTPREYYRSFTQPDKRAGDFAWPHWVDQAARERIVSATWPFERPLVLPSESDWTAYEVDHRLSQRQNRHMVWLPTLAVDELSRLDEFGDLPPATGTWLWDTWGANIRSAVSHLYVGEYRLQPEARFGLTIDWRSPQRASHAFLADDYAAYRQPTWSVDDQTLAIRYPHSTDRGIPIAMVAGEPSGYSIPEFLLLRRMLLQQEYPQLHHRGEGLVYTGLDGQGVWVQRQDDVIRMLRLRKIQPRNLHRILAGDGAPSLEKTQQVLNLPSIDIIELQLGEDEVESIRIERRNHRGQVRGRLVLRRRSAMADFEPLDSETMDTYQMLRRKFWFKPDAFQASREAYEYIEEFAEEVEMVLAEEKPFVPRTHWPMAAMQFRLAMIGGDAAIAKRAAGAMQRLMERLPSVNEEDHLLRENLYRSYSSFWRMVGGDTEATGDLLAALWQSYYYRLPHEVQQEVWRNRESGYLWEEAAIEPPRG